MNSKGLMLLIVGGLLLPVLPLLAGLIAGLGEWPRHALPRAAARPAAEEAAAERMVA